jgi:hypothetical protein
MTILSAKSGDTVAAIHQDASSRTCIRPLLFGAKTFFVGLIEGTGPI